MAEVMVDVLNAALGVEEKFGPEIRAGSKAVEVGASILVQSPNITYAFRIFGRPPRTAACDCERAMEPALPQTLYFMTDNSLQGKLKQADGRVATLLKTKMSDEEILDELFLATLSRLPTANDRKVFEESRAKAKDRATLFTNTAWALINLAEFRLQH